MAALFAMENFSAAHPRHQAPARSPTTISTTSAWTFPISRAPHGSGPIVPRSLQRVRRQSSAVAENRAAIHVAIPSHHFDPRARVISRRPTSRSVRAVPQTSSIVLVVHPTNSLAQKAIPQVDSIARETPPASSAVLGTLPANSIVQQVPQTDSSAPRRATPSRLVLLPDAPNRRAIFRRASLARPVNLGGGAAPFVVKGAGLVIRSTQKFHRLEICHPERSEGPQSTLSAPHPR